MTATEPRFAAKVAPRRRKKAGAVAELGQAAALMREPGATRVPPVAARARAEQAKRAEARVRTPTPAWETSSVSAVAQMQARTETKGTKASVHPRREEEIPD